MAGSPYSGVPETAWSKITEDLIGAHPLKTTEIQEVVLRAWNDIFDSRLGPKGFQIGKHIFPKPQIMGFLLHELIPLEFAARYPNVWRGEKTGADKDMEHTSDPRYSVEIKTSSHPSKIFGNRSYAQEGQSVGKKNKSGYYLAVNFGKFRPEEAEPRILRIRFGWIDHFDWIGQSAQSGQQAHLTLTAERLKLKTIYPTE